MLTGETVLVLRVARTCAIAWLGVASLVGAQSATGVARVRDCSTLALECDGGNVEACSELGERLIEPLGCRNGTDPLKAAEVLNKACDGGSSRGCSTLGHLYSADQWGLVNKPLATNAYRDAVSIFRRECSEGTASGCISVAELIRTSRVDGSKQEVLDFFTRGLELYEQMCRGGNANACFRLSLLHEHSALEELGLASAIDSVRALGLACEFGLRDICTRVAEIYETGQQGVPSDLVRALELYDRGCELLVDESCVRAGRIYETGGLDVPKNGDYAASRYERACLVGNCVGCENAATLYRTGTAVKKDTARANALAQMRCSNGGAYDDAAEEQR